MKRMPHSQIEGYYTAEELAGALRISPSTLANWRARKWGPPSIKIGRNTFYRIEAFNAWIVSRERVHKPKLKPRVPPRKKKKRRV